MCVAKWITTAICFRCSAHWNCKGGYKTSKQSMTRHPLMKPHSHESKLKKDIQQWWHVLLMAARSGKIDRCECSSRPVALNSRTGNVSTHDIWWRRGERKPTKHGVKHCVPLEIRGDFAESHSKLFFKMKAPRDSQEDHQGNRAKKGTTLAACFKKGFCRPTSVGALTWTGKMRNSWFSLVVLSNSSHT